jgi:hypothetical protein
VIIVLRWTDEQTGQAIVDIVVSLNEQAQKLHQQEVATASYSHVKPTLKSFDEIGRKITEVESNLKDVHGHPGRYLRSMSNGFRYFARSLQGDEVSYSELIRHIQELPTTIVSEEKMIQQQEKVSEQLANLGYKGTLPEKIYHWLEKTLITPEQVTKVAESFIKLSKAGTLHRVIQLPPEDGIDRVKSIRGVFWSGYSKYTGNYRGNLTFNIDRPWTEPILAQIMTHEAYPGHQAFYCRWDYLYQQGKWPIEASYYLINSPTNALFEGGPETALHFLGWDTEDEEVPSITPEAKKQYTLARDYLDMQRMATTNACYLYNLGQISKDEALKYMTNKGLINSIEARNAFRFFSDPIQKTYFPSYYHGRWMVGKSYDLVPVEKRAEYFTILYDTPHTTDTFIDAISELTGRVFNPFEDQDIG